MSEFVNYQEFQPSRYLAPYVKCYWVYHDGDGVAAHLPQRVIPDGCAELIFNFADPVISGNDIHRSEPPAKTLVVGQLRGALRLEPTGKVGLLGVRLRPDGAHPILMTPLCELTESSVALDALFGPAADTITDRVYSAPTVREKVRVLDRILVEWVAARGCNKDQHVEAAVNIILNRHGQVSIEQLSTGLGLARRQLERKFRIHVGIAPKLLARITRFQGMLGAVKRQRDFDWPSMLVEYDYYDQSHLIREFNTFAGQTPLAYFSNEYSMST